MNGVEFHDLMTIAEAMAQELRDYADQAVEAGNMQPGTEAILEEFDALWRQAHGIPHATD